jgi:tetratricopeptide (TPR) repeat protein
MFAARDLGDWRQALDLNAEIHASRRRRGASPAEQANTRFNDYYPLLRLGRVEQARDLLIDCRAVFETSNDIPRLGRTLGALAHAEAAIGHLPRAIELATDALRYAYLAGDPAAIATGHNNLAAYLRRAGRDPRLVWAHGLAAAVIRYQTGDGALTIYSLPNIAGLLGSDLDTAPGSFAEVSALETAQALEAKDLVIFVPGADNYDLTELGVAEVRRLQAERAERAVRASRGTHGKPTENGAATSHTEP